MTKILRGLRGATTARANTSEAILQATAELLRALLEANAFQPDDVESARFTSSTDLTAQYPACAAGDGGVRGAGPDVIALSADTGARRRRRAAKQGEPFRRQAGRGGAAGERWGGDATACRVVRAEGDGLAWLVVVRYGPYVVA